MAETDSELVQLRSRSQVTLPAFVRKRLGLDDGDLLDVSVRDGEIVLRPKRIIDRSQAWFWSDRWQKGEKQAEQDLLTGATHTFEDGGAAVEFLHARVPRRRGRRTD
jgi:AbrB family looped-hinge helix DNA binding protein